MENQVVTQQGAAEVKPTPDATFSSKRAEMLEVIASRLDQEFDEKVKDHEPEIVKATPGTFPDHEMEIPEVKPEPEAKKIKLVVDGQEREIDESEVMEAGRKSLQKLLAADKRLEEASKLKKEVQELREHILRSSPEGRATEQPKADAQPNIQQWVSAIRYGTEEEAAAAFQSALEAMKPREQYDPRQVGQIVDARLSQAQIVQKFSAPPEQGGFGDLVTDPYLFQIATIEADRLLQSGAPNSWDTYVEAGRKTREWRDKMAGSQPRQDPATTEKAEKKKSIDNIPSASARTVTGTKEPEREPTPSEIIEQMRKSRVGGQ